MIVGKIKSKYCYIRFKSYKGDINKILLEHRKAELFFSCKK